MHDLPAGSIAGHLDVLGSVPSIYREAILAQCAEKKFQKGEIIWNQGDAAGYVAFLVEGAAMSTFNNRNGKMGITGIWFSGDILGAADLGGYPFRQLTVRCLVETRVFTLPTPKLFKIVARFPELGESVIRALSVRLRWIARLALTLETQTAFERVCTVLLALSEKFSVKDPEGLLLELKLTNEELASFVGVTRQFMNSVLKDLQAKKLILLKQRKIVIRDRDRIEALVFHR
jgi:CRP-like cAMP-binding protein